MIQMQMPGSAGFGFSGYSSLRRRAVTAQGTLVIHTFCCLLWICKKDSMHRDKAGKQLQYSRKCAHGTLTLRLERIFEERPVSCMTFTQILCSFFMLGCLFCLEQAGTY